MVEHLARLKAKVFQLLELNQDLVQVVDFSELNPQQVNHNLTNPSDRLKEEASLVLVLNQPVVLDKL